MLINCDIGERGAAHPIDDQLMTFIDIANIACGGHAGDEASIRHYVRLANTHRVRITAHLSYPDQENFGRQVMDISDADLLKSLERQHQNIGNTPRVKLHGALYNEANINARLANLLAPWLKKQGVFEILTPHNSALAMACIAEGILPVYEAFLDRSYMLDHDRIVLTPRGSEGALIEDIDQAKQQFNKLKDGFITINDIDHPMVVQTLCVHSDSPHSLAMVKAIKDV